MTKNEEKAIEILKNTRQAWCRILSRYIDKQQKEIERKNKLIEKNRIALEDCLKYKSEEDYEQKNEIEEKTTILLAGSKKVKQLEKEIEELKENELLEITENFVSKDKIREIIENIEEDIDYLTHDLYEDLKRLLEENDE